MTRHSDTVYQIKITLDNIRPPIWRRVQVPGTMTLGDLHDVIQVVMGWEDYHLHQFDIRGQYFGVSHPDYFHEVTDESRVQIRQAVGGAKFKLKYEYDFGDDWRHTLLVEKVLPPEEGVKYPRCLTGKRACPLEDVGGFWGYAHYLEVMGDTNHPEHEMMVAWRGKDFDAEVFNLEDVNEALWARFR